jgi:DNA-binding NtrC family response regulator
LLVEDDLNSLKCSKQIFEEHGYEVKTAETVKEAFSIIEQEELDIIITDYKLPNSPSGGFQIIQKAYLNKPPITTVLHTGYKTSYIHNLAKNAGAYKSVLKSSSSKRELISIVAEALEIQKQKGLSTTPFSDGTANELLEELESSGDEGTPAKKPVMEFVGSKEEFAQKSP